MWPSPLSPAGLATFTDEIPNEKFAKSNFRNKFISLRGQSNSIRKYNVSNKAKGRISKRVFQENKAWG